MLMKRILMLAGLFALLHTAQAQTKSLIDQIHKVSADCNYYEVTQEMFDAISEDPRFEAQPKIKEIKFLIFMECPRDRTGFFEKFIADADLKDFKVMMRRQSNGEHFTFYRKKTGDMYDYLLVHDHGVTYMATTLNISNIQELQSYIQLAGALSGGN